jgi:hypothetical protein
MVSTGSPGRIRMKLKETSETPKKIGTRMARRFSRNENIGCGPGVPKNRREDYPPAGFSFPLGLL